MPLSVLNLNLNSVSGAFILSNMTKIALSDPCNLGFKRFKSKKKSLREHQFTNPHNIM